MTKPKTSTKNTNQPKEPQHFTLQQNGVCEILRLGDLEIASASVRVDGLISLALGLFQNETALKLLGLRDSKDIESRYGIG